MLRPIGIGLTIVFGAVEVLLVVAVVVVVV